MPDNATSTNPAVQAQLDRLWSLSPGADVLGLDRITQLLDRIGNPHLSLPPIFHVAGTNGKGSTCAFLRAALEADGKSVHVFTSPHLVRFNERIRINGALISDALLAKYLERILDLAGDIGASFFEVTTAAAFLAFADHPADAAIIEVGLGGRLDATNILPAPAVCGIAQLGIDHQSFLGDTLAEIAAEKAGIAKPGVPLITSRYAAVVASIIATAAETAEAPYFPMGSDWDAAVYRDRLHYRDGMGKIELPLPRLPGPHQPMNAALAIAMLRHQDAVPVSEAALKAAPLWAQWPARLQRLDHGPLTALLSRGNALWLDGGHNEAAGEMLAKFLDGLSPQEKPVHLIVGMLSNKDVAAFLQPMRGKISHIYSLPVPGHDHHRTDRFEAIAREWGIVSSAHDNVADALAAVAASGDSAPILIAGSLYLAGDVLLRNDQLPD
ncbi:bifunctional folylpolyglutamate synthase/dihydrofolate synthase [Sphingobium sp. SCG-1]|uniref:bifunctional folylpolyglutamate synthase/dihydrofolate synthase n=1 Tax=Sphingobium sp. SCG-1 TaxID=2072936 RepID=UPI000CD6901D|nr:folylpolyglutamate synthase/dihydrofolate synthase family protein [Sphingobium sp. SCG-1]AUW58664.1 bifunctional folylpolyglutamate synthase/dihydrofolate synthase [Sphingobium sp. SCG-1]